MPPTQSDSMSGVVSTAFGGVNENMPSLANSHHQHSQSSPALPLTEKSSVQPSSASAPSSPAHSSQTAKRNQTVIIFDWDDTLLASSFLSSKGYRLDSEAIQSDVEDQLKEFEVAVGSCLQLALQYGEVHIITNAETGWVQLSAQKFIPNVAQLLNRVKIISARSTYEQMFPEAPLKWKYYAMHERLSTLFTQCDVQKNIISLGDSYVEREAIRAVTKDVAATYCKSVKFAERPSMEQLRRQIELVTNCFPHIHDHFGDLDLQLTVTINNPADGNAVNAPQASAPQMPPPAVSPQSCLYPQNAINEDSNDAMNMMAEDKGIAC